MGQHFKYNIARYEKYTHKKKKWKPSDQLCRALKDKIRIKLRRYLKYIRSSVSQGKLKMNEHLVQ